MEDKFRIGVITKTHGIKGEVKVYPTTSEVDRFDYLEKCTAVSEKGVEVPLVVTGVKYFKDQVILKFEGYDTIESVEPLLKKELFVSREDAIPLEEGEYYVADIIGATVIDTEGNIIGKFKDYMETPANDVYIIETTNGKEIMIPAVDEFILNVDTEENVMRVKLIKGMM